MITTPCAGFTLIWDLTSVIIVSADVLAPISFRPPAGTMLTAKVNMADWALLAEYPRCMGSELGQLCAWRCPSTYRYNMLGHQQAQCSLKHASFLVYLAVSDSFLVDKPDHGKSIFEICFQWSGLLTIIQIQWNILKNIILIVYL